MLGAVREEAQGTSQSGQALHNYSSPVHLPLQKTGHRVKWTHAPMSTASLLCLYPSESNLDCPWLVQRRRTCSLPAHCNLQRVHSATLHCPNAWVNDCRATPRPGLKGPTWPWIIPKRPLSPSPTCCQLVPPVPSTPRTDGGWYTRSCVPVTE